MKRIPVDLVLDSDGDCIAAIFGHHGGNDAARIEVPWRDMNSSRGPLRTIRLFYRVPAVPERKFGRAARRSRRGGR